MARALVGEALGTFLMALCQVKLKADAAGSAGLWPAAAGTAALPALLGFHHVDQTRVIGGATIQNRCTGG